MSAVSAVDTCVDARRVGPLALQLLPRDRNQGVGAHDLLSDVLQLRSALLPAPPLTVMRPAYSKERSGLGGMVSLRDYVRMPAVALRETIELNLLGLATAPLLSFVGPRVLQNDATAMRLLIPLSYRTRNHVGSMYFGALSMGADLACGLPVLRLVREQRREVIPTLRDMRSEFLRRATGDVVFETTDVPAITRALEETVRTEKRVDVPVAVIATVPSEEPNQPVARFLATLSLKYRANQKLPFIQRVIGKLM